MIKSITMKSITNDLRNFFAQKGITQQEIADKLGTSRAYVTQLINRPNLTSKTATRFSELYGLSVPWLLTGEGPMMAADVQTGNSVSVVTHGDNSPAAGGDQRITTETDEFKWLRDEIKSGFDALKTEISALKTEVSALESERGRLLSIIENLTGGTNK